MVWGARTFIAYLLWQITSHVVYNICLIVDDLNVRSISLINSFVNIDIILPPFIVVLSRSIWVNVFIVRSVYVDCSTNVVLK
jgi:hypothetical protein